MPIFIEGNQASQALDTASRRGLLPSSLGSSEMRAQIGADIRRNSVFSARTASAHYLQALKGRIERMLQGGRDNDMAQVRLELKQELTRLGYTPERGFPGDAALGIPPAKPGSLRDLASDARLNLILETQASLLRAAALKARGLDPQRMRQFPCWELVRLSPRRVERGSAGSKSPGWAERWERAGGPPETDDGGYSRLIALKTDPVWAALGDSALFHDALDVDHPPFAFRSGMSWKEVHWEEAGRFGFTPPAPDVPLAQPPTDIRRVIDPPRASAAGLDGTTLRALKARLRGIEQRDGVLTIDKILDMGRRPSA